MNILVTGAKGMVGTALVNNLKNIKENKNRTRPSIHVDEIYEYDIQSTEAELDACCKSADFVFHLAGVNRPENPEDFMRGNFGFTSKLLDTLKKYGNKATIMLSSSVQGNIGRKIWRFRIWSFKEGGRRAFLSICERDRCQSCRVSFS